MKSDQFWGSIMALLLVVGVILYLDYSYDHQSIQSYCEKMYNDSSSGKEKEDVFYCVEVVNDNLRYTYVTQKDLYCGKNKFWNPIDGGC